MYVHNTYMGQFKSSLDRALCGRDEDSRTQESACGKEAIGARGERSGSLVAKRNDRIDGRCLPGWEVVGKQHDSREPKRDCAQRHRIVGLHVVEETREYSGERQGSRHSERNARRAEAQADLEDKQQHVARLSAERHADADLPRAQTHNVGHHTVNARNGERECHESECAQERGEEARTRESLSDRMASY